MRTGTSSASSRELSMASHRVGDSVGPDATSATLTAVVMVLASYQLAFSFASDVGLLASTFVSPTATAAPAAPAAAPDNSNLGTLTVTVTVLAAAVAVGSAKLKLPPVGSPKIPVAAAPEVPKSNPPAVAMADLIGGFNIALGVSPAQTVLLVLALFVSALTLGNGRTNILFGAVHLSIFAMFLLISAVP